MTVDPFTERLARVRQRFVETLTSKIEEAYAAVPQMVQDLPAVEEIYRSMHGIVGIGPIVGFPVTGRAARDVENILRPPREVRRALTDSEVVALRNNLDALRDAAQCELETSHSA